MIIKIYYKNLENILRIIKKELKIYKYKFKKKINKKLY